MTVMFCDLIGSTALFARRDPEEVGHIFRAYLDCCAERIEAGGGFVAQFQGDGVLGYFGYAEASEDSAEQAVRTGLDILDAAVRMPLPDAERPLRLRIGIATGLVVVGDPVREGTRLEQSAVGETLHLAARLQAVAGPNAIVIADSTRRLTGRLFRYRDIGRLTLKGFAAPVQTWQVLGARPSLSQFHLRRVPLLTQLVGREAELEALLAAWRRAAAGHGQVVQLVGEAGIGKSRLINEFRHRIARQRHAWFEGGGAPSLQNTPFHAVAQTIRRGLDPAGRASPVEFRARLERALATARITARDALPLLSEMLDLPGAHALSPPLVAPNERRQRLFSIILDWLRSRARRRPLVIVTEDLHWLDPSSLELAGYLAERIAGLPVLMLQSMRSGARAGGPRPPHVARLILRRLSDDALRRLVARVGRTRFGLSDADIARVVQRAEGVPLFGIELARFVSESAAPSGPREIPSTLADLLTTRLDQLGPGKQVAQIAAVIGDEVPLRLLEAVSGIAPARLRALLRALIRAGVLREIGRSPSVVGFSHSLLREAAYHGLLRSERRQLHRRTAAAIAEQFAAIADTRPELLADHLAKGGDMAPAAAAWELVCAAAASRRAYAEAEQAYGEAIAALAALPPSPERDAQELALRSRLVAVLHVTRGYSAPQTVAETARARALADRNGDRVQQIVQMQGAWVAASSGGDHDAALKLAGEFLALALADGTPANLGYAHMMLMTSCYRVGDLTAAEDHFISGEPFFSAPGVAVAAIVQTHGNAARIAWTLGDDAAAQRRSDLALAAARASDSPHDLAFAEYMGAGYAVLCERYETAAALAQHALLLSERHAFPQFAAVARVALGRAQAGLGPAVAGVRLIRDGLMLMAAAAVRTGVTLHMTWLGEALLAAGLVEEAQAALDDALRINPRELFFRPETLRLYGEVLAQAGMPDEAEARFLEALALANRMGARRFRDRATHSLQCLLRRRSDEDAGSLAGGGVPWIARRSRSPRSLSRR